MPYSSERKSIGEKYSLDYYRNPRSTRTWKWPVGWLTLLIAIVAAALLFFFIGEKAFQAAPLSSVHATLHDSCRKCHVETWQPAMRLATANTKLHSVSNPTCQSCHQAQGHQSTDYGATPACVDCHQEHRPDRGLLDIADSQCVACHADLKAHRPNTLVFQDNIETFTTGMGTHPEIAILRSDPLTLKREHGTWKVARVNGEGSSKRWVDQGGVRFNHALHLAPEGILNSERVPELLTCRSCHAASADGMTMSPLSYEVHCADCHPLRLGEPFSNLGNLPHESPEIVRGVIRDRLSLLPQSMEVNKSTREKVPLLPTPPKLSGPQEKKVHELVAQAEHALLGLEAKGHCRKCHYVDLQAKHWEILRYNPAILNSDQLAGKQATSPIIPRRWLTHGRFDHGQHLWLACQKCHAVTTSTQTADILLPSIQICRQCHGSLESTTKHKASGHCIECHDYHQAPSHWHNVFPEEVVSASKE